MYTDGCKSYDVLDVSEFKHERINHGEELVDDIGKHINGLENFWNQAQRILRKYNGIPRNNFGLFIKELFIKKCAFRFNYGTAVVPKVPKSNYGCSNAGSGRRG